MEVINPIDVYISGFPEEIQHSLTLIRQTIKEIVPEATEKMCYMMPTFYLNGNLVHFAAFKNHIGLYPSPSGIAKFSSEFGAYKWSKGAVQFPIKEPLPLDLIRKIVQFRKEENILIKKK